MKQFVDGIKKWALLNVKGFKVDQMAAATCLFEGDKDICERQ